MYRMANGLIVLLLLRNAYLNPGHAYKLSFAPFCVVYAVAYGPTFNIASEDVMPPARFVTITS